MKWAVYYGGGIVREFDHMDEAQKHIKDNYGPEMQSPVNGPWYFHVSPEFDSLTTLINGFCKTRNFPSAAALITNMGRTGFGPQLSTLFGVTQVKNLDYERKLDFDEGWESSKCYWWPEDGLMGSGKPLSNKILNNDRQLSLAGGVFKCNYDLIKPHMTAFAGLTVQCHVYDPYANRLRDAILKLVVTCHLKRPEKENGNTGAT